MPQLVQILSTRVLSDKSVAILKSRGIKVLQHNFIATESILSDKDRPLLRTCAQQKISVVFTSANAVKAVAAQLQISPQWEIFCISGRTKETIEEVFPNSVIVDSAAYGKDLALKIMSAGVKEITFFSGKMRLDTLPDMLSDHAIRLNEIVAYQTKLTPLKYNEVFKGILFFSPSAVESYFSMNQISKGTVLFSIGSTTSSALNKYSENVLQCDFPSEEAMVGLVNQHYF